MSCPKTTIPTATLPCRVSRNWKWVFPNRTLDVVFTNPVSNEYNLGDKPILNRTVCNFNVENSEIPACTKGFFTKNGNLYIDVDDNLYCAYQIGRNENGSYIMRSQDGFTTSLLYTV